MLNQYTTKDINRFWNKVDKNGCIPSHCPELGACWEWTAYCKNGYGYLWWVSSNQMAHRVSWLLEYGQFDNRLRVLHKCDNPTCVNPSHLFLGTQADNVRDMIEKGRRIILSHERNGRAKLTWSQVRDIRSRYALGGITIRELAEELNVTPPAIRHIVNNMNWRED